jgi:hypothetical protein
MTATRLWALGCIVSAAFSAYLGLQLWSVGFDKYAGDVQCRFIAAQRDATFKLLPELRPSLRADQLENAARAANLSTQRTADSLRMTGGIEFVLAGTEVSSVRTSNF